MRRLIMSFFDWCRPRKQHSFLGRWGRNFVICLLMWLPGSLFSSWPWWRGLAFDAGLTSFMFAVGQFAYFHVYGGTDEDYPFPPTPGPSANP